MKQIKLISLQCTVPDEIDKDEVYLKFRKKKIWPKSRFYKLDTGDKIDINVELQVVEDWVEIELWDFDYMSLNDHLGVFKFKLNDSPGKYSTTMTVTENNTTASYILYWQLF
jgi:hypothetical protein